jgi:enoyl-CoA hydratase/carnithine racemase
VFVFLQKAEASPDVKVVVVEGQGEKAFCAGGDILGIYVYNNNNIYHCMHVICALWVETKPTSHRMLVYHRWAN